MLECALENVFLISNTCHLVSFSLWVSPLYIGAMEILLETDREDDADDHRRQLQCDTSMPNLVWEIYIAIDNRQIIER